MQGPDLSVEAVAADLVVTGDTSVEDGPPGTMTISAWHDYSPKRSVGSTSRALASLRMVRKWGSTWLRSILTMVVALTPDFSDNSVWVKSLRVRASLSLSPT